VSNNHGLSNLVKSGIIKYVINMMVAAMAITDLIGYEINSISVTRCIWGTRVISKREITGIVTITILCLGGGIRGVNLKTFWNKE
jgi:hypothetical protein